MTIYTFGHGTLSEDSVVDLLREAGITRIADVRSFPGSRRNPQFRRDVMGRWLSAAGLGYSWMGDLGGRRRAVVGSRHVALRHPSFRAYADHMETPAFIAAVDELVRLPSGTAATCSESVWWRCHRRLLADYLVLVRGEEVLHLMHDGRLTPHPLTDGVRLEEKHLVYDVGVTPPLPSA